MLAGSTEAASAAQLCAALSFNGVRGWFLPSRDELAEMYKTLRATGLGDFRDAGMADNCEYWARSEEHTSDLQSLMRISYAVFCLKKKKNTKAYHIDEVK